MCSLHDVTRFCIQVDCAEQVQLKWAQRKINRAAKHRVDLLAATKQLLEKELSSSAVSGASPVLGDDAVVEQDSPKVPSGSAYPKVPSCPRCS
jgi:hypothetical protein